MMFSTAQEKIHPHQLVPANSNLSNATTDISFVFTMDIGSTIKITGSEGSSDDGSSSALRHPQTPFWAPAQTNFLTEL